MSGEEELMVHIKISFVMRHCRSCERLWGLQPTVKTLFWSWVMFCRDSSDSSLQTSRSDTTGLSQSLILSNLLPGIQRNKSQPKSSPCFKSPGVRIIRGLTRKRWTWYLFLSGAKQIENNIFQTNLSWLCIRVNHRNHFKFVYFIYSESLIRTCNLKLKQNLISIF